MKFNYGTIGKRVKELRKKKKLSQEFLAELTELSATYISLIESGTKCMSLETLIRVANALNVTADTLLADCLTNHIVVSHMEYSRIFEDCSTYESRIIIDVAKAIKQSLRENNFILSNLKK